MVGMMLCPVIEINPRWKKLLGDVRTAPGRLWLAVAALALSGAALTAMLAAYVLLMRAVTQNYLGTNPASAQLLLDRVDATIVQKVGQRPDVAAAEATSTIRARVVLPDGTRRPLLLFVIPDFTSLRINTFRPTSGAWPPPDGSLLLERSAMSVAESRIGEPLVIESSDGSRHNLRVAGTVHDPALAPAWQEQVVYGYVTPETLRILAESPDLHLLKLIVRHHPDDARAIEATARSVAASLTRSGHVVREIRVPPPRMHPHQAQMEGLLSLLLLFSVLGLILGSVLAATVIGGLLAQQLREMAVMKAIGARSAQIMGLYLALVGAIGALAALIGIPVGLLAGRAWANATAHLLNLELGSEGVPAWLLLASACVMMLVCVAAAAVPVTIACRRTVQVAIRDFSGLTGPRARDAIERWVARIGFLRPGSILGIRNAFRRRGRLMLTASLLATAGAVFMASVELKAAWNANVATAAAARHYDLEIWLRDPAPESVLLRVLRSLPGVRAIESWPGITVTTDPGDHVEISHTYSDEGHGRISLRGAPRTSLVDISLTEGRWLRSGDTDVAVLNSMAHSTAFQHVAIGDFIDILAAHQPQRLRVVGFVRELMTPSAIYTTPQSFGVQALPPGTTNAVRVALTDRSNAEAFIEPARRALEQQGVAVRSIASDTVIRKAQGGHVAVLVFALGFIALTMAAVGVLGLAAALSTSVTERIREYGVLRAIGASRADIRRAIVSEGLAVGLTGAALALPLSIPVSDIVGSIVGFISLQPLTMRLNPFAIFAWLALSLIGSAAASAYPSAQASRVTVREALVVV
jgi:putative ABC transport system permease protein